MFKYGLDHLTVSKVLAIARGEEKTELSKEAETKGTDVTETGVIAYAIRD